MTELLKKTKAWVWGPAEESSFVALKEALVNSAELAFPDFSKLFTVHLDASASAIGATLSQENDAEHLRLITCTSRKLNPAERN